MCQSLPYSTAVAVKTAFLLKEIKKIKSDYLFPNHESNNNFLIPVKAAKEVVRTVLMEEELSKVDISELVD